MPFPSVISTLTDPQPTDRLNSPSHSGIEQAQNSAIEQVETVIGLSTTSLVGTLFYDIRSPLSNGGGHVQTANKGGTGQTSFTKGDILVAQSSSVLTKLAVGLQGQALTVDSSVATGVKWANPGGTKIYASTSIISVASGAETSIFSTTVQGSLLGTNNAVVTKSFMRIERAIGADSSIYAKVQYGGATIGSVILRASGAANVSVIGSFNHTMIANGAANQQRHITTFDFIAARPTNNGYPGSVFATGSSVYSVTTSSVESTANQTYGVTLQYGQGDANPQLIQVDGTTVNKII